MTRRALLLVRSTIIGAAVACGSALAAPAWAGVSVTPAQAVRGDAAKLTFRVTDDRAGTYTTKVELRLPTDAPVAEVYPMSVPDWAPQTASRTLDRPVDGLHHGATNQVTSTVTWTRVGAGRPGGSADLAVSLGPMPETDRLAFSVVQTYSDGTVVTWGGPGAAGGSAPQNPALTVTLLAGPAAAADHGSTHGGGAAPAPAGAEPAAPNPAGAEQAAPAPQSGSGMSSAELMSMGLAGGLAVGLGLGAVAIAVTRRRTVAATGPGDVPDSPADGPTGGAGARTGDTDRVGAGEPDSDREPVAAGTAPTAPRRAWRLRD